MHRRLVHKSSIGSLLFLALTALAQSPGPSAAPPAGTTAALAPAPAAGSTAIPAQQMITPGAPLAAFTGSARVNSKVDKLIITVGEIINYGMEVEIPQGYVAAIPPPGAQLGQFLIRKYDFPEPEKMGDRMVQKFNFSITAYATGELSIPPVPVLISKDKQLVKVILTEEIKIVVAPVTSPEDMEIKDIKPPLAAAFDYRSLVIMGLIIAGIIALALGGLYGWRRLKEPRIALPEPLPEPEELALKELNELLAMGLLEKGELDRYYTKLSEIIRRYLGLRFQVYALEFTTSEIMDSLKNKYLEHRAYQLAREFLDQCDLVKFARFVPEAGPRTEIMGKAREIVEITRPAPVVEAASAGAGAA